MSDPFDNDAFDDEEKEKKQKSLEFAKLLESSLKRPQKKLVVGDKIRGEILVIGKEEVFVSTGPAGVSSDGIVPRKDLVNADGKIDHKVGDVIDLYVIQVRGSEVYLSPKPTAKNLADDLEDAFDMMLPVEGKVTEVCKGGVRVSLMGKVAFCPISQLDTARVENPEEYLGRKLEFMITQFSEGGRNIVVSRKKILQEQREVSEGEFSEEHQLGDVLTGKVKRLEAFGAFVELRPGVEGLLHVSEISWSRVNNPADVLAIGQEIRVKVLKTESNEGRLKISLSMKQVEPEPWKNLPAQLKEGETVEGKVTRFAKFGAFVELAPGVEGLIHLGEMSETKRVMHAEDAVKLGEQVRVLIKEVNPQARRISLSLKDAGTDPNEVMPEQTMTGGFGTLGDQFKAALAKKKG